MRKQKIILLAVMFIFALLAPTWVEAAPPYTPYRDGNLDRYYEILFCENLEAFRPGRDQWEEALFQQPYSEKKIRAVAEDRKAGSWARLLAYRLLRSKGAKVSGGVLLGVIIERADAAGLNVMAIYGDGSFRYITSARKVILVDGAAPPLKKAGAELLRQAQKLVMAQKTQSRMAPPRAPHMRMSLLMSDGLYVVDAGSERSPSSPAMAGVWRQANTVLAAAIDQDVGSRRGE